MYVHIAYIHTYIMALYIICPCSSILKRWLLIECLCFIGGRFIESREIWSVSFIIYSQPHRSTLQKTKYDGTRWRARSNQYGKTTPDNFPYKYQRFFNSVFNTSFSNNVCHNLIKIDVMIYNIQVYLTTSNI